MHTPPSRGMGLVEVVVGIALMLIVFTALFGVLRLSVALSTLTRTKTGALELASSHMEYLRGLSYASLGTVNGTPSGTILESTTTTLGDIPYTLETRITYHDDPADGTGSNDDNGITADYKIGEVRVLYVVQNQPYSITLVSNFAPSGVETAP